MLLGIFFVMNFSTLISKAVVVLPPEDHEADVYILNLPYISQCAVKTFTEY